MFLYSLGKIIPVQCINHKGPVHPNPIKDFIADSAGYPKSIYISSNGYIEKARQLIMKSDALILVLDDLLGGSGKEKIRNYIK